MTDLEKTRDLARWIVEHGADRPAPEVEHQVPLYLPIPEIRQKPEPYETEINYEI